MDRVVFSCRIKIFWCFRCHLFFWYLYMRGKGRDENHWWSWVSHFKQMTGKQSSLGSGLGVPPRIREEARVSLHSLLFSLLSTQILNIFFFLRLEIESFLKRKVKQLGQGEHSSRMFCGFWMFYFCSVPRTCKQSWSFGDCEGSNFRIPGWIMWPDLCIWWQCGQN